jgi:hypothetical protein
MRHVPPALEIMCEVQVLHPVDPLEDSCDLESKAQLPDSCDLKVKPNGAVEGGVKSYFIMIEQ